MAVLAFFLALLAREAALVLPLLLLAVDRIPPDRPRRRAVDFLPYVVVAAVYLVLRALAVGGSGSSPAPTSGVPLGFRLLTSGTVLLRYLGLLVLPRSLHMERLVTPVASVFEPRALAAVGGVAALVVLIVWTRRRAWPVALGCTWFLIALVPVSNLVPLATFMAEHWLYVPSMGIFLAAGWGIATVAATRAWRPVAIVATVTAVAALATLTIRRNVDWRDARTLYESLLPLAPESLRVRINLAEAYQEAGDVERARVLYDETVRLSPAAPETADALNNLGNIERDAGRLDAALAAFDRALALNPRHVSALNGRALTLQQLGRVGEAEQALAAALMLAPDSAVTHSNLGNLYFRRDELERAREQYLVAVRLDPDYADAHNNLGSTYFRLGERGLAEGEYRTALRLNPRVEGARRNLAVVSGPASAGPEIPTER
jgi:Flp pilus assembly protein TadD